MRHVGMPLGNKWLDDDDEEDRRPAKSPRMSPRKPTLLDPFGSWQDNELGSGTTGLSPILKGTAHYKSLLTLAPPPSLRVPPPWARNGEHNWRARRPAHPHTAGEWAGEKGGVGWDTG